MSTKTISIGFDGVIYLYNSGWQGETNIPDLPVTGAFEAIENYIELGYDVVICSTRARDYKTQTAMREWFEKHGMSRETITRLVITNEKRPSIFLIDDRVFHFKGRFPLEEEIENFKPWTKVGGEREDQKTIHNWARETFPHYGASEVIHRTERVIEEVIELAVAAKIDRERIIHLVSRTFEYASVQKEQNAPEEAGDTLIALLALAEEVGYSLTEEKEKKMVRNRSKPKSFFEEKRARKRRLNIERPVPTSRDDR